MKNIAVERFVKLAALKTSTLPVLVALACWDLIGGLLGTTTRVERTKLCLRAGECNLNSRVRFASAVLDRTNKPTVSTGTNTDWSQ